ncbi:37S ribosomal protein S24, mitochondrial [Mycoemilia scoparia]|uniref:37S ribosomal protein S24, mitochondrial n=1 Tax=Mycoemilia scoparia TaxID=417184 RepID=A0A9W7ZRR7_9FUNG|nr:37S ribosomal protein S24, mitochondrial [Mycoemilia scoparia]
MDTETKTVLGLPEIKNTACAIFARTRKRASYRTYNNQVTDACDIDKLETDNTGEHTTYGHLLLENIRDVRHYLRKIKYEIPTLAEHYKPFIPPTEKQALRFKTTKHYGINPHPGDKRVTLTTKVSKLGLTNAQKHKFLLLVGPRYNPATDELKMTEDKAQTIMENKKLLSDTLDRLLAEAKNNDDMFEDIPLTFPHHKPKTVHKFPEEWLPKPQQQQQQQ